MRIPIAYEVVMGAEDDDLQRLLGRCDPSRSFAHQPGDPVWDLAASLRLVLFLDELSPELLDSVEPFLNPECAPVHYHNGRPYVTFWGLNDFLPYGFEPGTLWTDAWEAGVE
jgi:hypothetical protein